MEDIRGRFEEGLRALRVGDWPGAKERFEAALKVEDSPDARDGLGVALWWLNEIEASHQQRAIAFAEFAKSGQAGRAAGIAAWLAREQVFLHSNGSAMNGWFARANRLLADAGPCPQRGWYIIWRASMLDSPPELERSVEKAMEVARAFGDVDLETTCLAFRGIAAVQQGRVDQGLGDLDEAMVVATSGVVESFSAMSEIFCVMLSACELVGDLERTDHWCLVATEFARQHHCPFLSAYCRTTHGGLLVASGRWLDAEAELLDAIRSFDAGHRGLKVHAAIKLADLRVQQGRAEEAEILLAGYEDHGAAAVPRARLHLARGETGLARAVVRQALGTAGAGLDRAPLILLRVEILLAADDLDSAGGAAEELAELARQTGSDLLWAQAELAFGQIGRHRGAGDAADHLQSTLYRLRSHEQCLIAGRARLEMARVLQATDWPGAVTWARAALATFERIGATRDVDETSGLLRQLGVAVRPGPKRRGKPTQREEEVLGLLTHGLSNREIADRLVISTKTAEHHVSQILDKLGARTRAEAAALAAQSEGST